MSFYTAFEGKVIFIRLSSGWMEKPSLRVACSEVIGYIVRNMTAKQSEKEGNNEDIDDSLFDDLIIDAVEAFTCERDVADRIITEFGMENAVEVFDERSCESLEELVEEHGHRNEILAYHTIRQLIEWEINNDLLCDLVRHALRFIEGNEYEELEFRCE